MKMYIKFLKCDCLYSALHMLVNGHRFASICYEPCAFVTMEPWYSEICSMLHVIEERRSVDIPKVSNSGSFSQTPKQIF